MSKWFDALDLEERAAFMVLGFTLGVPAFLALVHFLGLIFSEGYRGGMLGSRCD